MSIIDSLVRFFTGTRELPSPSDIVPEGSIRYDSAAGLLLIPLGGLNIPFTKLPIVFLPLIPDTNSMDPAFDFGHNNILIQGADADNQKIMLDFLKVGDIAVYRIMANPDDNPSDYSKLHKAYVIHRIVEIGYDSNGKYFRFRGDNNAVRDPHKARDRNILWLCAGTIF